MINGVTITPLKCIEDDRGVVMHMLRNDSHVFRAFGEIYFSTVHPGAIKAWNFHERMILNYAVPYGEIIFVLHDTREDSSTLGRTEIIRLGVTNYALVTVPPRIWTGFKGVSSQTAIVANCASVAHDPSEISKKIPSDPAIGFDWTAIN